MKKRFSAFLLAALMVAALLPAVSFAAVTVVSTTEQAQAALDAAVDGTHIKLAAGNYDILYLRKNENSECIADDDNWAGGGHTYKTTFKNLTIEGGEGVTVKGIRAEAGTYTRTGNQHSNSAEEAFLNSYIIFENLKVKNITFTMDEATVAVELASAGQKVSIDGLTIDNCVVNGVDSSTTRGDRLFNSDISEVETVGDWFTGLRSNIRITNCEMNDLHQGIKMNCVDGLIVEGNKFNRILGRDLMIGGGESHITGTITISSNTFDGSRDRVLRMNHFFGNLVMNNNTIVNYAGSNQDYIKVDGGTPDRVNTTGNTFEGEGFVLNLEGGNVSLGEAPPAPVYGGPVMNWVKVNTADNGVVKSGPLAASEGATITLYPKAAAGYVLDTVEVLDAEGNAIELDGMKFKVPLGGVTVNATFKLAE